MQRMRALVPYVARSVAVIAALAASWACSESSPTFQPVAYGAKPWQPPAGWDPEPPCVTGYFVAIDTCQGCTGISYALCDGDQFSQCVCGGSFSSGASCPQQLPCSTDDFPPPNWVEFTDYAGPGWAGLDLKADAGDGG